jgi:hypothetical protein
MLKRARVWATSAGAPVSGSAEHGMSGQPFSATAAKAISAPRAVSIV